MNALFPFNCALCLIFEFDLTFLDCVNYRLNWTEKGVEIAHHNSFFITDLGVDLIIV